jgi:hypothetical protein
MLESVFARLPGVVGARDLSVEGCVLGHLPGEDALMRRVEGRHLRAVSLGSIMALGDRVRLDGVSDRSLAVDSLIRSDERSNVPARGFGQPAADDRRQRPDDFRVGGGQDRGAIWPVADSQEQQGASSRTGLAAGSTPYCDGPYALSVRVLRRLCESLTLGASAGSVRDRTPRASPPGASP